MCGKRRVHVLSKKFFFPQNNSNSEEVSVVLKTLQSTIRQVIELKCKTRQIEEVMKLFRQFLLLLILQTLWNIKSFN